MTLRSCVLNFSISDGSNDCQFSGKSTSAMSRTASDTCLCMLVGAGAHERQPMPPRMDALSAAVTPFSLGSPSPQYSLTKFLKSTADAIRTDTSGSFGSNQAVNGVPCLTLHTPFADFEVFAAALHLVTASLRSPSEYLTVICIYIDKQRDCSSKQANRLAATKADKTIQKKKRNQSVTSNH